MSGSSAATPQPAGNPLDAFLRPESMITPGALGAMTMLITNALANNFPVGNQANQVTIHGMIGIFLSFVFGVTAVVNASSFVQKGVYYIINSLIIFSVAMGSNTLGVISAGVGSGAPRPGGHVSSWLLPSAYALSPTKLRDFDLNTKIVRVQFFQPWVNQPAMSVAPPAPAPNSVPPPQISQQISPQDALNGWSVVVGSMKNLPDAQKFRDEMNRKDQGQIPVAIAKNPSNGYFAVTLGAPNLSISDAAELQKKAVADNLAQDAYIKRTSLLQPVE